MKRKKKIKPLLLIIIALVIAGTVFFVQHKRRQAAVNPEDIQFTVRKETYDNIIDIAGTISAANSQQLQAAGVGRVTAVYVKEGDHVKKGSAILKLDDTEQRYNLARHLYDMDVKRVSGSPRELELMKAQLDVLEQRLDDRQVLANFDGVIAKFTARVGDVFEAKDAVGVIIDRSYLRATVDVVETDAPKLKPGQKVSFSFPAYPEHSVEGYVVSFPSVGVVSSLGTAIVEAQVRIDNPPDVILPNFSFTGQIEISPPVTVLIVERDAAAYEGGAPYVERILSGGGTERVKVEAEPFGAGYLSILSGLAEGDTVRSLRSQGASGRGRAGNNGGMIRVGPRR